MEKSTNSAPPAASLFIILSPSLAYYSDYFTLSRFCQSFCSFVLKNIEDFEEYFLCLCLDQFVAGLAVVRNEQESRSGTSRRVEMKRESRKAS